MVHVVVIMLPDYILKKTGFVQSNRTPSEDLYLIITYSMEQSSSLEANWFCS